MSSDDSSSSDSEILAQKTQKKTKDKSKKSKPSAIATPHGRNEGTDNDWAYKPPKGTVLADHGGDAEEFDWDALKSNPDVELWVVRVPEGVKAKHLQGLKLDAPSSSKTARIGSLARKQTTYDVWSLGEDSPDAVGAEEVKSFSTMLPRKKKGGKVFLAPEITTRHIVLSAQPVVPSAVLPEDDNADMSWSTGQNPPRPSYPKELLKHRFMPYGSLSASADSADVMNVDEDVAAPVLPDQAISSPKKKRRVEDEETKEKEKKKSKKAKKTST